jgi:hypothetical protein
LHSNTSLRGVTCRSKLTVGYFRPILSVDLTSYLLTCWMSFHFSRIFLLRFHPKASWRREPPFAVCSTYSHAPVPLPFTFQSLHLRRRKRLSAFLPLKRRPLTSRHPRFFPLRFPQNDSTKRLSPGTLRSWRYCGLLLSVPCSCSYVTTIKCCTIRNHFRRTGKKTSTHRTCRQCRELQSHRTLIRTSADAWSQQFYVGILFMKRKCQYNIPNSFSCHMR